MFKDSIDILIYWYIDIDIWIYKYWYIDILMISWHVDKSWNFQKTCEAVITPWTCRDYSWKFTLHTFGSFVMVPMGGDHTVPGSCSIWVRELCSWASWLILVKCLCLVEVLKLLLIRLGEWNPLKGILPQKTSGSFLIQAPTALVHTPPLSRNGQQLSLQHLRWSKLLAWTKLSYWRSSSLLLNSMVCNGMILLNLDSKTHQYFLGLPNFPNIKGFGGITWILSGILVGAQRKGEISTTSGTSVADTTPAEVEVADQTDDDGGLSLAELEKECEKQLALAMAQPEETPTDTPQPEETPTGTPQPEETPTGTSFGSKGGGGKGRGNPVKPIPASGNSGNLALALTSGGGLTPSQLHTQELETEVVGELKKFSEEQFEAKVEELKQHHEFKSYCDAVRLEIGEQEDAAPEEKWEFGEQECYLDVVRLMVWIRARQNMRRALGVQVPALGTPSSHAGRTSQGGSPSSQGGSSGNPSSQHHTFSTYDVLSTLHSSLTCHSNSSFTCPNSSFTCPNSSFTCPNSSFTCPNSSFTCPNSSFTCHSHTTTSSNRPNSSFTCHSHTTTSSNPPNSSFTCHCSSCSWWSFSTGGPTCCCGCSWCKAYFKYSQKGIHGVFACSKKPDTPSVVLGTNNQSKKIISPFYCWKSSK